MKTKVSFLSVTLFCVLFSAIFFSSCKNSTEKKLVGKWRLADATVYCDKIEEDSFNHKPGIDWLRQISKEEVRAGRIYEFSGMGKFYSFGDNPQAYSGTFTINGDTLILINENKVVMDKYVFNLISDSKFEAKYWVYNLFPAGSYDYSKGANHNHLYTEYYERVR